MKNIKIDLSDVVGVLALATLIILFAGDPDLMYAILFKITGGTLKP